MQQKFDSDILVSCFLHKQYFHLQNAPYMNERNNSENLVAVVFQSVMHFTTSTKFLMDLGFCMQMG